MTRQVARATLAKGRAHDKHTGCVARMGGEPSGRVGRVRLIGRSQMWTTQWEAQREGERGRGDIGDQNEKDTQTDVVCERR